MNNKPDTGQTQKTSLVVIAIGGNSLIKDDQHRTVLDQYNAVGETARHIVPIVSEGHHHPTPSSGRGNARYIRYPHRTVKDSRK